MAYSSQADIQGAIGSADLIACADVDGDGVADATIVAAAIEEADRLIDSYAHKRHAVPFATTPATIAALSARMAVRILRRNRRMVLVQDVEDEKADRKWLEELAKGLVSVGVEPAPQATELSVDKYAERDTSTKAVSRARLKGFW